MIRRVHRRRLAWLGCSALLALGCGGAPPESQTGAATSQAGAGAAEPLSLAAKLGLKQPKKSRRGPRSSTGTAWRNFTFFVPDAIEGYRARTATEGHEVDLTAGMSLTSIKRAYGRDNVLVEVEVLDTARCDRVRQVFNRTRDLTRESRTVVIRPMRVKNFKALTQWYDATKVARTSVLVADRFLVNISAKPADAPAASLAVADKLDWAGLEKLSTQPLAPAEPLAEPIEGSRASPAPISESSKTGTDAPESELTNTSELPESMAPQPAAADAPLP